MTEKEKKEAEIIVEEEQKDDNLLKKFDKPSENKRKIKKQSPVKAMVIALVVVCVLVGGIFIATRKAPEQEEQPTSISAGDSGSNPLVDNDKMWQADVKKTKKGKVKNDTAGNLLELIPSDIKKIELEHEDEKLTILSETPTVKLDETDPDTGKQKEGTDATVYTLVGFEDFDLKPGTADEIANICSTLEYTSIASADASGQLSDYGMDKPRAVANITFDDNTKAVIKVGSDIVQGRGTYVMFGSGNEVFVCETERVEPLLTSLTGMISLTINDAAANNEDNEFKSISLSGSNFKNEIVIEPNPDTESVSNTNILTAPVNVLASDQGTSAVSGAVRGLYADEVVYLNPDSDKLKQFGLAAPYAKLVAEYPDTTVSLIASKPDSEGNVCVMKDGDKVIYKMKQASLPWVTTTLKALTTEYVLNPKLSGLKEMKVTAGGKDYSFKIKTTETKTTDDNGEETSTYDTVTKFGGKELNEGNFETYFRNASLITKSDYSASSPNGKAVLTIRYTYSGSRNPDTIAFYNIDGNKYAATVNGTAVGKVYASYVDTIVKQTSAVSKDDQVNSVW